MDININRDFQLGIHAPQDISFISQELEDLDIESFINGTLGDYLLESTNRPDSQINIDPTGKKRKYDIIDGEDSSEYQEPHQIQLCRAPNSSELNFSGIKPCVNDSTVPLELQTLANLYHIVSEALNKNNIPIYSNVVGSILHPDSHFSVSCPGLKVERTGYVGLDLMKTVLSSFSGVTSLVTKSKIFPSSNGLKAVGYCRIKGTSIHPKMFNKFFGLEENVLFSDYLVDEKKTTQKTREKLRATELMATDFGRNIDMCIKVVGVIDYDATLQFSKRQYLWIRASSFRLSDSKKTVI